MTVAAGARPITWQTELERTIQRFQNVGDLVAGANEPALGQSPRQEVYRKHKARLYY